MAADTAIAALRQALGTGLMSFPLTDFDAAGELALKGFRERLEWLDPYGASAVFVAGGAGEFFSLTRDEYSALIGAAVAAKLEVPTIATAGYGTRMAIDFVTEAERLGAGGILLLPPYLTESSQAGIKAHIKAVCAATSLGVIIYNRANARLKVETLEELAETCPNLVGFKDGVGDMEEMLRVTARLGDRLVCINGMPTAEVYAQAYAGMGIPSYSSAIFNFVPKSAMAFQQAVANADRAWIAGFVRDFLDPYCRLRAGGAGYAVSIVKAGARLVGKSAGPVRPPLSDLTEAEHAVLERLIAALGPQDI